MFFIGKLVLLYDNFLLRKVKRRKGMIPLTEEKRVIKDVIAEGRGKGVGYIYLEDDSFNGRKVKIGGREVLNFGNCSYLGLEIHPKIKRGVIDATEKHGSLLSNSRSYFSSPLYSELEKYLAQIFPGYQVVTTTTTLGHCSVMPLMIESTDVIIMDQFAHNSMRMGAMLCKAAGTEVKMSRHNDINHLVQVYNRLKNKGARNIWYLGDGIYSMQGNKLKIKELIDALNENEQLFAYIDDAHGMSWTGKKGAGFVLGHYGIHPKMIVAVSMCKSFAAFGGVIIFPDNEWADRVRLLGQSLIFSAPISPPVLGAAIASAKIHLSDMLEEYQEELLEKIIRFRERCREKGIPLGTTDVTPIQFIEVGDNLAVYSLLERLIENGIFVTAAIYPAMPKKHGGIRVNITRHLKMADIDYLVDQIQIIDVDRYRTVTKHHHDAA